jgi:hypothetical protein
MMLANSGRCTLYGNSSITLAYLSAPSTLQYAVARAPPSRRVLNHATCTKAQAGLCTNQSPQSQAASLRKVCADRSNEKGRCGFGRVDTERSPPAYVCVCACVCACVYMHARTRKHTRAHARAHAHTHARAHARTHARTHTHSYVYTRTLRGRAGWRSPRRASRPGSSQQSLAGPASARRRACAVRGAQS